MAFGMAAYGNRAGRLLRMETRDYPDLAPLLIVLEEADSPVWRRVHVSFFTKLGGLHRVIQAVMG